MTACVKVKSSVEIPLSMFLRADERLKLLLAALIFIEAV